jgi:hypothetical protein
MDLQNKYIKAFSQEIADCLKLKGFEFIQETNGVYWFKNNESKAINFSDNELSKNIKFSTWINI